MVCQLHYMDWTRAGMFTMLGDTTAAGMNPIPQLPSTRHTFAARGWTAVTACFDRL